MYQVIVVDDEKLTLDYLKMSIPKQDSEWEVAAIFPDGIAALDYLSTHTVDLIITDIKMPELSGLQLCKRVKEFNPKQKIIILSGYDDFKYAQEAIQYGIQDYLLKPISLPSLKTALAKIKTCIKDEHLESIAYKNLLELSNHGKKQIATRFIHALIEDSYVEIQALHPIIHRLKISLIEGAGLIMLLSLDEDTILSKGFPAKDISLFRYMLYQLASEYCSTEYPNTHVTTDKDENTLILLSADSPQLSVTYADRLYQQLSSQMLHSTSFSVSAGISDTFSDIFELANAYQQSKTALCCRLFIKNETSYMFSQIPNSTLEKVKLLNGYILSLYHAIREKNEMNQQLALQSLLELIPDCSLSQRLQLGLYWIKGLANPHFSWTSEEIYQALSKLSTISSAPEKAIDIYNSIASSLYPAQEENHAIDKNSIVSRAEHFIHANYAEPISLALVADYLKITPNYLSALFHKELGQSYNKYVTQVRMEHATRLMKETPEMKVFEIAEKVGYVSAKHFSYVFKQYFGITPGEYQQKLC